MLNILLGNISSGLPFVRHSFRLRVPAINCIVWRIVPIRPPNNLSQTKLILTRLSYANTTIRTFLSAQDACGVFRWPRNTRRLPTIGLDAACIVCSCQTTFVNVLAHVLSNQFRYLSLPNNSLTGTDKSTFHLSAISEARNRWKQ